MADTEDTWDGARALVLHELTRLAARIETMDDRNREDHAKVVAELSNIKSEISGMKVRSGFYGALAGLGGALVVFFSQFFGGVGHS